MKWTHLCAEVCFATNQRGEFTFRKRKWDKLSGKEEVTHKSTVCNKQFFLVVEGVPFLGEIPVTGRTHSHTGVCTHTYTSQGVYLCDSYTVIILDG
jgi:hypothetical protein